MSNEGAAKDRDIDVCGSASVAPVRNVGGDGFSGKGSRNGEGDGSIVARSRAEGGRGGVPSWATVGSVDIEVESDGIIFETGAIFNADDIGWR